MKILFDDEKVALPDGTLPDVIIRTYEAAMAHWEQLCDPDFEWYVDHDLGGDRTGYDFLTHVEEAAHDRPAMLLPAKIVCVSNNGAGRLRIEQVIANLYRKR